MRYIYQIAYIFIYSKYKLVLSYQKCKLFIVNIY